MVGEHLKEQPINTITFIATGTSKQLLDRNEVALRKAIEQHRTLKKATYDAGIRSP